MALTTTQVNQAFLATLGRPAEGSAATWGSTSLSLGALSDSIFIAENTEDFVESLYTEILGRASDAEGKAFWNSLLATTSKEAVLAQFKAAVIAAGQADPSNADYQSFIAQNKAFVATLYANLLGRDDAKTADAEGVDFWANALATGMSRGDLISAFVSAALSDPNSDDAQTLNAKLSVADAFSAAFNDFGKDVTADEKKAALDALKTTMTEVVAGSTVEEFQDTINQFKGQNQDRKTDVFTKGEDDLDASESTAATTFRGTINISNPDKSTIESGDAATGNSEYAAANTLIVDVKSDGKEKDFNFGTETAGVKVSNVNNLTINNGTADVTLNLTGGDNYTGKVAIAGKGDRADVTVDQEVASLSVSTSGAKKAYADTTVTANATLGAFEGSAAVDTLNINGTIAKSINTGDGKDEVTLGVSAKVFEKATISLGGGDDTLTINTSDIGNYNADGAITENLKASVTIDGGNGKDTLELSTNINYVSSIVNVENIKATTGGTAAISAVAADGLKTTVSGDLTINASYDNIKSIDLRGIKSEKAANGKTDTGTLKLSDVTNENITLSSNIKETIILKGKDATSDNGYAEISKFASGDKIQVSNALLTLDTVNVDGKKVDLTRYADVKAELDKKASADVVAINDTNGKASYIWQKIAGEAKLIAVADKTLKKVGTNFELETTKPTPTPDSKPQANDSVNYTTAKNLQGGNTFDLTPDDSGNFTIGNGDQSVKFKALLQETDTFTFTGVNDSLTLSGSGVAGTVKMYLSAAKTMTLKDDINGGADLTTEVYVGGTAETTSSNKFDISNTTLTNIDKLFINTTAEVTVSGANVSTGKINFTSTVDEAGAKITFSNNLTATETTAFEVESLFAKVDTASVVDGNEIIKYTVAGNASNTNTVLLNGTKGQDHITLATDVTKSGGLTLDLGADNVVDKLDATAAANVAAGIATLPKLVSVKNAKAGDMIKLGAASAGAKADQVVSDVSTKGSNDTLLDAIKGAFKDDNKNSAFIIKAVYKDGTAKTTYLLAVNDGTAAYGTGDKVIELLGVNDTLKLNTTMTDNYITLA